MMLEITRDQTLKLIKSYYKIYQSMNVDVNHEVVKGYRGYYEEEYAHVNIIIETKKEILGEICKVKFNLNEEEIKNIFEQLLQKENYNVTYLGYDAVIDPDDKEAKFNGMKIEVESNQKQKVK